MLAGREIEPVRIFPLIRAVDVAVGMTSDLAGSVQSNWSIVRIPAAPGMCGVDQPNLLDRISLRLGDRGTGQTCCRNDLYSPPQSGPVNRLKWTLSLAHFSRSFGGNRFVLFDECSWRE